MGADDSPAARLPTAEAACARCPSRRSIPSTAHGAVRVARPSAVRQWPTAARRAGARRRPVSRRPDARAVRRGRPAHAARVGAADRRADPRAHARIGARDGPFRAERFPRSCGVRATDDFFAGRPLRKCPPRRRDFPPVPAPPRLLSQVEPVALGGRPGRTLSAVALTLVDSLDQVFSAASAGLRRPGRAARRRPARRICAGREAHARAAPRRVRARGPDLGDPADRS